MRCPPRRPVRRRHRRQHADRDRAGAAGQAHARQPRHRQRPEGPAVRDGAVTPLPSTRSCSTTSSTCAPASRSSPTRRCSSRTNLEIDESLLTGEAEPVVKAPGDEVLSGSFVVAGSGVGAGHQGRRRRLRRRRSPRRRGGSRWCTASCAPPSTASSRWHVMIIPTGHPALHQPARRLGVASGRLVSRHRWGGRHGARGPDPADQRRVHRRRGPRSPGSARWCRSCRRSRCWPGST